MLYSTAELINAFENATRAHERLGSMKRDDESTRERRKTIIAEYAEARRALLTALNIKEAAAGVSVEDFEDSMTTAIEESKERLRQDHKND